MQEVENCDYYIKVKKLGQVILVLNIFIYDRVSFSVHDQVI